MDKNSILAKKEQLANQICELDNQLSCIKEHDISEKDKIYIELHTLEDGFTQLVYEAPNEESYELLIDLGRIRSNIVFSFDKLRLVYGKKFSCVGERKPSEKENMYVELHNIMSGFEQLVYEAPLNEASELMSELGKIRTNIVFSFDKLRLSYEKK